MSRLQHSVDTPKKTHSITFEPPQYYQPQHPLFQQAEATFEKLVKRASPAPVNKRIYIVLIKQWYFEASRNYKSSILVNITPEIEKNRSQSNLLATKHISHLKPRTRPWS